MLMPGIGEMPCGTACAACGVAAIPSGRVATPHGHADAPHGKVSLPHGIGPLPRGSAAIPCGGWAIPCGETVIPRGMDARPGLGAADVGRACGAASASAGGALGVWGVVVPRVQREPLRFPLQLPPARNQAVGHTTNIEFHVYVKPIEIFSDETNAAVLRHWGRKFPGVLIQGDSLAAMVSELRRAMKADDSTAIKSHVDFVLDSLEEKLAHYTTVLNEHGIEKPWGTLEP